MGMSSSPWNIVTFTPSVSACSQPAPCMGPHRAFYRAEIKAVCYGAHNQRYESHPYTML